MLKISVVMLVTAAFAGLLIYNPYERSSNSPALLVAVPPTPANGTPTTARAETVPAGEAPIGIKPQDIEGIVLKVLADRFVPQERDCSGAVAGALHEKAAATIEPWRLRASNGSQQRPLLQCVAEAPVVQSVSGRHEDPSVSGMDGAMPDNLIANVVRPVLVKRKDPQVSRAGVHLRLFRRARAGRRPAPVVQPVSGRHEDASVSAMDGPLPEKAVGTVAQWPLPASNQQPPVLQSAAQSPAASPVLGKRKGPTASRVDGHAKLARRARVGE